jgi:RNA polymerase sigma factor (sigma-70 family)
MEAMSASFSGPTVRPPPAAFRLASDARLARWAAAGRDGAMAAIFERHHQALHRYCHSIVGNGHDAADALQNTMVKALGSLPGERRAIALRPWLYRIAHNESISLLRARRADSDLDAAREVSDVAASGAVESRARLRSLTADLGELTDRQRGALLMRELSGLEFTEVADALGTSPAAAKQSVYEARCALQAMQEGRAMDCDVVRRTLSDGDRRMLRAMKMRGHLRACAGCRDFQAALRQRPAQLAALIQPLQLAKAAAILHGLLGGAGHGGGGLTAGLVASAKAGAAHSVGANVATAVVIAGSVAGGVLYVAPSTRAVRTGPSTLMRDTAGHDSRPIALPAAREHDDAVSTRVRKSGDGRVAETSTRRAATTPDELRDVAGQQPEGAGSAPTSSAASARPLSGLDRVNGVQRRTAALVDEALVDAVGHLAPAEEALDNGGDLAEDLVRRPSLENRSLQGKADG